MDITSFCHREDEIQCKCLVWGLACNRPTEANAYCHTEQAPTFEIVGAYTEKSVCLLGKDRRQQKHSILTSHGTPLKQH